MAACSKWEEGLRVGDGGNYMYMKYVRKGMKMCFSESESKVNAIR